MTPDEFEQLDDLFNQALSLSAEQAIVFAKANTTPGPLRDRLLKMLQVEGEKVDSIIAQAVGSEDMLGARVGDYQVVGLLGKGGMGAVYLANRIDSDFQQQVAVKILRTQTHAAGMERHFLRERRLLAQLQHPNIAHLLDGGTTQEGKPYVVMEYVQGQPLNEYCNERVNGLVPLLRLFMKVCSAVQYAHQRLIVHRDLKPGNIIVNQAGEPKLLDFGIAKILADGPTSGEDTETLAAMMTPQYASPEQVQGHPITTASDIYSLGVILYELVCGRCPFNFAQHSPIEVERIITTQRPEAPSQLQTRFPAGLGSVSDLDNVILKALHPDPEARYASVSALAADLDNLIIGRPVTARPDTLIYRTRKLIQRHPAGSAMALTLVAVLIGATGLTTWQSFRLAEQRDRAQLEMQTSTAVSEFMVSLFQVSDPLESRKTDISARELLRRGSVRIQTDLADAPETQARLLQVTALSYANLGDYESGLPLLERSIEIRRTLGDPALNDLAESLNRLGNYHRDAGQLSQARDMIHESVEIRERLVGGGNDSDLADSYNNYGLLLFDMARYDEARQYLTQSLAMHRAISGDAHMYVGIALHNLALIAQAQGDYEQAQRTADEALSVKRRVESESHPSYANTLELKSGILRRKGDFNDALDVIRQARNIKLANYPTDHPRVATNIRNEAMVAWDQGQLDEARTLLESALEKLNLNPSARQTYISSMTRLLGELATEQRRFEAAEDLLRQAAGQAAAIYGETHPNYAHALDAQAELSLLTGDQAGAIRQTQAALAIYEQRLPDTSFRRLRSQARLVRSRAGSNREDAGNHQCDEFEDILDTAVRVNTRQRGFLEAEHAYCLIAIDSPLARPVAEGARNLLLGTLPDRNATVHALTTIIKNSSDSP